MSVPTDPSGQPPTTEHSVSVDLAAFLPEGVELAAPDDPTVGGVADTDEASAPVTAWRPDLAALDAVEADFDAVDEALRALDAGTYGICRACAQQIPDDQLAAAPARAICAAHA